MLALGGIIAITVGWWGLALVPVGVEAPEWLLRTRAACFGTTATGLPNAGGWVLLVGEPLGMVGTLAAVWGGALRRDLRWLAASRWGRAVLVLGTALLMGSAHLAGVRVTRALATERVPLRDIPVWQLAEAQRGASMALVLQDQHGVAFDLQAFRGRPVIVTFAFGHCEDVCPTIVRNAKAARTRAGREDIPLLVVTVDPWRDVPERLPHLAGMWALTGEDRVLGGTVESVTATLAEWGIATSRDARTGEVSHPATVMVLDANGRLAARLEGDVSRLYAILRDAQVGPGFAGRG